MFIGGTVVLWLVLWPHSKKKRPGLESLAAHQGSFFMECTYPKHFPSVLVGFPQPPWFPSTIRNMLDTFQLFLFCWINVTLTIFGVYNSKIYSKTTVSCVDTNVFRISTAQVSEIGHFDIFHSVFTICLKLCLCFHSSDLIWALLSLPADLAQTQTGTTAMWFDASAWPTSPI